MRHEAPSFSNLVKSSATPKQRPAAGFATDGPPPALVSTITPTRCHCTGSRMIRVVCGVLAAMKRTAPRVELPGMGGRFLHDGEAPVPFVLLLSCVW
jgi:hypothetical protein